jgi:hypothetical protein
MTLSCPRCGFTHCNRSTRRFWERLVRLRAYRCVACYHRFLRPDDDSVFWRIFRDRLSRALVWATLLGLILAGYKLRMPLG